MNEYLTAEWVERVTRLALGIECVDPILAGRIAGPVRVEIDGVPEALPARKRNPRDGPWEERTVLRIVDRKESCRHVIVARRAVPDPVPLRVTDRSGRYVPRRLLVELPDPLDRGRKIRPALFPAASYPILAGVVGMRGRVLRGGEPLRWSRIEARRTTDDLLVGQAFGDEHGEFMLILGGAVSRGAELTLPITVRITVFGPDVPPDPEDFPHAAIDPLWDVPIEAATLDAAGEEVLAGVRLPTGYVSRPGSTREVEFGWYGPVREEFDFS